ncbi:MAG: hypothetical protein MJZ82_02255 [Paludibacteraceae bacterium]|nr:hypothetical protein [Paludibacteraceae bacterium]
MSVYRTLLSELIDYAIRPKKRSFHSLFLDHPLKGSGEGFSPLGFSFASLEPLEPLEPLGDVTVILRLCYV